MKFTLAWLKEHLATNAQIDDIVELPPAEPAETATPSRERDTVS